MSHISGGMYGARGKSPTNTGAIHAVVDAIRRARKPLSIYKLQLATGLDSGKVRAAVNFAVTTSGKLISLPGVRGRRRYGTLDMAQRQPRRAPMGPYAIAGTIVYPGYVYGGSRLG